MYFVKVYNDSDVLIFDGIYQTLEQAQKELDSLEIYPSDKVIIEKTGE